MQSSTFLSRCFVTLTSLVFICHPITSFKCLYDKGDAPSLPNAFSARIRINLLLQQYTVDMKYAVNKEEGRELIEFKRHDRHVRYIKREDQKSVLFIQYKEYEHPTCKVITLVDKMDFLESEDRGENDIILKAMKVMMAPDTFDIASFEPTEETVVFSTRYKGCLPNPKINITISFAGKDWKMTHNSALIKDQRYPEKVTAEVDNVILTALYSYFDPTTPSDHVFQPPEHVYCDGFRADKAPPTVTDFFSYNAEMIDYVSASGLEPLVSHRQVFYDYTSNISRIDFHEPLAEDADMFSKIKATQKSVIHDFNSGVQYIFDPFTGKCRVDSFQETFNVISYQDTKDSKMLLGKEYFLLDAAKTSYNGQFLVRGIMADVYTGMQVDPKTKKSVVVSWFFATEETRLVESGNVEKNALLRMYVRPVTSSEKEGVTVINFYNFAREQPNVFTYDLSSCYNESSSKTLVLTFPGIPSLRGSEKLIAMVTHLAIKDATGIRKQRIYVKEVIFSGEYMYAEFTLLDDAPVKAKAADGEISVDDAFNKLKASIEEDKFSIKVPVGKDVHDLKPEPNGLNVFAGDRNTKAPNTGYKEGSVVGLTIGMLILGFLLGAVTLNLVMSRKFGISLFQKSGQGNDSFNNPLNESSI